MICSRKTASETDISNGREDNDGTLQLELDLLGLIQIKKERKAQMKENKYDTLLYSGANKKTENKE